MGGGSSTTKVTNKELEKTIQMARDHYAPGGVFKTPPKTDFTSAASQQRMDQLVAPQSQDTKDAYQQVRNAVGAWQPGLDQSRSYIQAGAQPTGTKMDYQGFGWSTDASGNRVFNTQDAYDKSYNQYTDQVVSNTLGRLSDTYDQQRLRDTDAAIKAGSFGGSRQGVQGALTNEMHMRAAAEAAAKGYSDAHTSALSSVSDLYGQGSAANAANNQIDQANRTAQANAGTQMASLEQLAGQLRAGDANALAAVGQHQQDYEQMRRDALSSEDLRDFQWPATFSSMMAGAAAPLTTTTTKQSGGFGSFLGPLMQGMGLLFSDENAKKDVRNVNPDKALEELRQLTPTRFAYTDDAMAHGAPQGRRAGFMAQDLEAATGEQAPELPGGYKGVDIGEQIGRLTHAVIAIDRKLQGMSKGSKAKAT